MLRLEIVDGEVLAFHRPPNAGRNVGGSGGMVGPVGSFQGLGYEALLGLGPGWHDVPVSEKTPLAGVVGWVWTQLSRLA